MYHTQFRPFNSEFETPQTFPVSALAPAGSTPTPQPPKRSVQFPTSLHWQMLFAQTGMPLSPLVRPTFMMPPSVKGPAQRPSHPSV